MIPSRAHVGAANPVRAGRPRPARRWGSGLGWTVAAVLGLVVVGYVTWEILPVLFASTALGYLLDRPVTALAARGIGREAAFALIAGAGLAGFLLVAAVVLPLVIGQIQELSVNLVPYLQNLANLLAPYQADIESRLGVPIPLDVAQLSEVAPAYLQKIAALPNATELARNAFATLAGGGLKVVLSLLTLTLVPLFTFYVCVDWPHLVAEADALIPARHRLRVRRIAGEIDGRTLAFVRGQVTLCFILGCVYSAGLLICNIDLAVVVGFLGGALFVIPYVGTGLGAVLAAVLALLKFGLDWHVVGAILTFVLGQLLEGSVLTPRIVGEKVGLHPMVVMVGVVVFGNLLGIWGLVIAVPLTAVVHVLVGEIVASWRQSRTYTR